MVNHTFDAKSRRDADAGPHMAHGELRTPSASRYCRVLVPTSLAARERPALVMAAETAEIHGARLILLHVIRSFDDAHSVHWLDGIEHLHQRLQRPSAVPTTADRQAAVEAWRRETRSFFERCVPAALAKSIDVQVDLAVGEVPDEVARYAEEMAVDLVVLTGDLSRGWLPVVPGRLRRILQLTRTPVTLVRPEETQPRVRAAV